MMEGKAHQPVPTPTVLMIDDEPDLRTVLKMTAKSIVHLAGMAEIPGLHTNRC